MPPASDSALVESPVRDVLLGLTTSSRRGGAALARADTLLDALHYDGEMSHAERILGVVDTLLSRTGLSRETVAAIGCDVGPGSFTGVRAGLAIAKGIALGLGVPVVAIGSLEAMAAAAAALAAPAQCSHIAVLLDARRAETFFAVYDLQCKLLHGPAHGRTADIWTLLEPWARGGGLALAGAQIAALTPAPAGWPDWTQLTGTDADLPSAAWVARLAAQRRMAEPASDGRDIEPVYLRAPDAKLPGGRVLLPGAG